MTDPTTIKYTADHEWVDLDGDTAAIGITEIAAGRLGDIVYVDLPAVGATVSAGDICGEIESTKSVGELYAPVSGEVVAVNDAVGDDPSLINSDPFGEGWLLRIRVDDTDFDSLLDREAYVALAGGEA